MSEMAMRAARLLDVLPETDQNLAFALIKKLVLAWDPDFTKLTPEEAEQLQTAEADALVDDAEVDWTKVGH